MEEQEELIKSIYEYNITAVSEHVYSKIPKVFIDGHTLVKVALTNDFVNCANYESRSGLTFQGCAQYINGNLRDVRGIYYVPINPIFSFGSRRKMTRNIDEIREIIKENISQNLRYLGLNESNQLLVVYDNYSVLVYDRYVKGRILKFPLKGEQGHLKIVWVPKLSEPLPYEKITHLEVYNHMITFEKEVIMFHGVTTFGGGGVLIYNQNDDVVLAKLNSPDHSEETVTLGIHELYLFSHPKPRRILD